MRRYIVISPVHIRFYANMILYQCLGKYSKTLILRCSRSDLGTTGSRNRQTMQASSALILESTALS